MKQGHPMEVNVSCEYYSYLFWHTCYQIEYRNVREKLTVGMNIGILFKVVAFTSFSVTCNKKSIWSTDRWQCLFSILIIIIIICCRLLRFNTLTSITALQGITRLKRKLTIFVLHYNDLHVFVDACAVNTRQ